MDTLILLLVLLVITVIVLAIDSSNKNKQSPTSVCTTAPQLPLLRYFNEASFPPNQYTILDTETTGLDACTCEVVEIGAIKYRDHKEVERFHSYIKPDGPLNEQAARINHITWADVRNAPSFSEVYRGFLDFIGNDTLVGYNIGFDIKFIQTRSGVSLKNPCFDVLPLARRFVDTNDHKLVTVKEHFGILASSLTALGDCEATAAVYQELLQLPSVQETIQQQPSWYGTEHFRLWEMGEQERIAGNLEEALQIFDQAKALCSDGSMPFLYESYAKAYRRQKEYGKEISILSEAIERCPSEAVLKYKERKEKAEELLASQQRREEEEQQRAERRAAREERRRLELEAKKTRPPSVRRVIQMDDNGAVIRVFPSVSAAAQEIGITPKGIRSAAKGTQKHAGGYCWKYADEPSSNPQAPADLPVSDSDT